MKTRTMSLISMLVVAGALATGGLPRGAAAGEGGGVQGGGGDAATEMRMNEIREDILSWIGQGGAQGLKLPSEVSYPAYVARMSKYLAQHAVILGSVTSDEETAAKDDELKVLVDGQPKTCRGFVSRKKGRAKRILCNVERFAQTSPADQYRLIHHEFAGLARLERNFGASSDYAISNQITDYLVAETRLRLSVKKADLGLDMRFVNPIEKCRELFPGRNCNRFWMGSPENEPGRKDNETRHLVELSSEFEFQTTPVTQADWIRVMKYNPSGLPTYRALFPWTCGSIRGSEVTAVDGINACANSPVQNVRFVDIQIFISKLNRMSKDGYFYRLPTEAEWEYSDRAGADTIFPFGVDPAELHRFGNYRGGSAQSDVSAYEANAFGIFGMRGGAYQILGDVADLEKSEFDSGLKDYCPKGGCLPVTVDPRGAASGDHRVVRGNISVADRYSGDFGRDIPDADEARSAARGGTIGIDDRNYWTGFRLVRVRK